MQRQLSLSLMAAKGEVLERFCTFSTMKVEKSKSMAITPFTNTQLLHEAEKITCDFDAVQAYLKDKKLSVGNISPQYLTKLLQRRPASISQSSRMRTDMPNGKFH